MIRVILIISIFISVSKGRSILGQPLADEFLQENAPNSTLLAQKKKTNRNISRSNRTITKNKQRSLKRHRQQSKQQSKQQKRRQDNDLGIGAGLFNAFPPMPTINGMFYISKALGLGLDLGYIQIPGEDFSGTSTYIGINGRYFFTGGTLFGDLAVGSRYISITTRSNFNVNDVEHPIDWTREDQSILAIPRLGWETMMASAQSLTFSLGVIIPLTHSFTTTPSPASIPGLPQQEIETEKEKKANDVKHITHNILPHIEFRYSWYFDVMPN